MSTHKFFPKINFYFIVPMSFFCLFLFLLSHLFVSSLITSRDHEPCEKQKRMKGLKVLHVYRLLQSSLYFLFKIF